MGVDVTLYTGSKKTGFFSPTQSDNLPNLLTDCRLSRGDEDVLLPFCEVKTLLIAADFSRSLVYRKVTLITNPFYLLRALTESSSIKMKPMESAKLMCICSYAIFLNTPEPLPEFDDEEAILELSY